MFASLILLNLKLWVVLCRTHDCTYKLLLSIHQSHTVSLWVVLVWRSLNWISHSSRIWIRMTIFAIYYSACLNMNTVFRTNSWVCYWRTLTTLKLWIGHTFIVILIWVILQILHIYAVSIWCCSCRCRCLHPYLSIALVLWRNAHCWIMLVVTSITHQNLLIIVYHTLVLNLLLLILLLCCWRTMKRMNWATTLCW